MPNTNLTVDWIGNEALRLAHEKAAFIGTINREFDSSFRPGYGNTIRIRVPSQYTTRTGRVMDVQDGVQQSTQLVVGTQWGVDMRYNSQEMSQDLVNFQKLHLEPAMAQLVSMIESSTLQRATEATYNTVGLAGSTITTLRYMGLARARLNQYLAPKGGGRNMQIDSVTMSDLVDGFSNFTNPASDISEQYREGFVARTGMADFYENERVYNLANTSDVTAWLDTYTIVDGDVDFTVSGLSIAPTAGMVFTVTGGGTASTARIFACHPETKEAYSHAQQFVVTGGTTTSLIFQPPIRLSGARKNVCNSDGTDLTTSGTAILTSMINFIGSISSTYPNPLMYHRDAFTFATAALPLMDDAIRCVVKTYDGLSLRVWEGSDIRNDEKLTRIDILWGFAAIRPQWSCRLIGGGV